MRISIAQMNAGHDKAANIEQARAVLSDAIAQDRPDIVALPDMWTCLGGNRDAKVVQAEELPAPGSNGTGGAAYEFLRGLARTHGVYVHGGSIGEKTSDKLFNTTIVFNPDGHEIARYRKIHLFDITTPDGTGYRESATFGSGEDIVTFQAGSITFGCAICYDVRFPELFLELRRKGAEVIFLPAAFTLQTGKDHWETLIRARAIETQCWIAAPATCGKHLDAGNEARFTYGHSLIVEPWGHVVAKVPDGIGWTSARIDPTITAQVRRNMPVLEHRKLV